VLEPSIRMRPDEVGAALELNAVATSIPELARHRAIIRTKVLQLLIFSPVKMYPGNVISLTLVVGRLAKNRGASKEFNHGLRPPLCDM